MSNMPKKPAAYILLAVLAISVFYAWTIFRAPPADQQKATPVVDVRIQRLIRYNQRLQHALAKATSTPAIVPGEEEEEAASGPNRFAYVFYATANTYACSVLVNIARLRDLNTSFPIHVLVSPDVGDALLDAMEDAGAEVHIETPPKLAEDSAQYYKDCLLKLLAFKMHILVPSLERVLMLDSDQLIMKNLDHLFEGLPDVDLAAPRAYWLARDFISSTFMMISLSDRLWETVEAALDAVAYDKFDMDLVNDLFGDTVLMLGGGYVTINSHWEDWNLPRWFHAGSDLNFTTVELVNNLVHKLGPMHDQARRNLGEGIVEVSKEVAQSIDDPLAHEIMQPAPRFPALHPITRDLFRLRDEALVIHFYAVGKPWRYSAASVRSSRPDAHPVLADLMGEWRVTAAHVCPGGMVPEAD